MKIAVVDDDKALYGELAGYLKELLGNSAEIKGFISGEAFLSDWRSDHFDLIILDIYNVKIVFSTSGNEFASESYEVNARYYLHKPFGIERVKAMLDRIDITGLEKMRAERLPDDSLIRFCENTAANAVLLYFAQQAKSNGIDYIVKAYIPSNIFVTETDISVIVGNLLDACKKENSDNKKIAVNASFENGMLCITVDNTYTGTLKYTSAGNIVSTKHSGSGLGTQSVKNIAARYCGICSLEAKNGMFYASVLCAAKQG